MGEKPPTFIIAHFHYDTQTSPRHQHLLTLQLVLINSFLFAEEFLTLVFLALCTHTYHPCQTCKLISFANKAKHPTKQQTILFWFSPFKAFFSSVELHWSNRGKPPGEKKSQKEVEENSVLYYNEYFWTRIKRGFQSKYTLVVAYSFRLSFYDYHA